MKYCRLSAVRKMIAQTPMQADEEKCSTEDYAACALARQHRATFAAESRCPFLEEARAQFCAAAPVTKFILTSDAVLSECGSESHQTCKLYLARP